MLDSETKRRIDTCRDILVGKVPDPKSQVEQITVALIYKFMNDMDLESEELGGERRFFTGDFERYRWSKLVMPGVSGQDMLNTYSEALTKMVENERLPALFRSIFRNAYLPYRDPETLRSFLREIDHFTYDHSERLGDAFEYLLSVLGSQGDAGQFRTPRHIIDFMVEIIDPKKNEVILDPACGTAGFLISAYKHILKTNSTHFVNGNGNHGEVDAAERALESPMRFPGDLLTTEDRERLARSIKGYDISPDMVRLSLVNLYLHGFADPKVEEYDTLTSDEKWTETADVIFANPPFMSPKGGIRPHTRFQVQSNRSEVLFVDYIAEHLTPRGRAAIVVPEGIIFQSQSAYVALRKMLVENFLAAVISLPAGVFNPYSGVKTSILVLDRAVGRANQHVTFFKIDNDGFQLGAQRKAIKGTQLPHVKQDLSAWLEAARAGGGEELQSPFGFAVSRRVLLAESSVSLSAERYVRRDESRSKYPMVSLGDETLFRVEGGGTPKSDVPEYWGGAIAWATLADLPQENFVTEIASTVRTLSEQGLRESSAKLLPPNSVLVSSRATIGRIAINRVPLATNQGFKNIVIGDVTRAIPEYVALAVTRLVPTMQSWATGGTFAEISKTKFCELEIPLPPLKVQRELVDEIEAYRKVIDGARAVVSNYRPYIPVEPNWSVVELGTICQLISGQHIDSEDYNRDGEGIGYLTGPDDFGSYHPVVSKWTTKPKVTARCDDVLVTVKGSGLGKVNILKEPEVAISRQLMAVRVTGANANYVWAWFRGQYHHIQALGGGAAIPGITRDDVLSLKLPLPSAAIQEALVRELAIEQGIVDGVRDLIGRFERKIDTAIARVWSKANADEVVA